MRPDKISPNQQQESGGQAGSSKVGQYSSGGEVYRICRQKLGVTNPLPDDHLTLAQIGQIFGTAGKPVSASAVRFWIASGCSLGEGRGRVYLRGTRIPLGLHVRVADAQRFYDELQGREGSEQPALDDSPAGTPDPKVGVYPPRRA